MKTSTRRFVAPIAAGASALLVLAACVGDAPPEDGGTASADPAACETYADYGTFDNAEVSVYASIVDLEADRLQESWAEFESCTGITIEYEGNSDFEAQIAVRAQGGNAPDLAFFPQPGLLASMADQGYLVEPAESVEANVDEYWDEVWKSYGTVDGTFYGAPLMANIKGFVWYSPSMFAERGWEVPTTLDEVDTLTSTIADAGTLPWCVGFGSGTATGWPGTDWLEDYVLRLGGPDVYDQWVSNEIPFDDPQIVEALDRVGSLIKNPEFVNGGFGGVDSIATTEFGVAGHPILESECAMMHQASFYSGFWPDGTEISPEGDVWAFMLPGAEEGSNTVVGGGELVGAFETSDEITAVQTYLSSAEWANSRVSLGGVISANSGLDPQNADSELLVLAAEILTDPETTVRFDASDLMPSAVGAGTFFTGMVNWISGDDSQQTLTTIQDSWPTE